MASIKQTDVNIYVCGATVRKEANRPVTFSVIIDINRDLNVSDIIWGVAVQKKLHACKKKSFQLYFYFKSISTTK